MPNSIDRIVLAFAGTVVLISLFLGLTVDPWWFSLAAFVGLNLIQSALTGFFPPAFILKRMGVRAGAAIV